MQCLLKIFRQHLTVHFYKTHKLDAKVTTYKWRGYIPIAKAYNRTKIKSNPGLNFKALQSHDSSIEILYKNYLFVSNQFQYK